MQESGVRGYAHVIKEDTVNPNLLFLGTEFGLWISVDGGQRWAQYKGSDFPAVAVRDIVVQARESDLVLATHGRGIWIIDDISPLRALTPDLMSKEAALIPGKADSVPRSVRRLAGRRRDVQRPQPSRPRRSSPTTRGPPHLWRSEDRNSRRRTAKLVDTDRGQQASRREPRDLVDAPEAAGGSAGGDCAVRAAQGRACCRAPTR